MQLSLLTDRKSNYWLILASVFLCTTLIGCATNPVTGKKDLVLVSEERELEDMGERYHPHLVKYYGGEYDNPKLQAYIVGIGEDIAKNSHRDNLIYHFTILNTAQVNAFATPGYIYITRGMLAYLNSEAELAAVLGHEMGHITARHSVRQHTKNQLAMLLAQILSRGYGNRLLPDISQFISTIVIRGYGRKNELEADRLGIEYIAKAGYPPDEMLEVLKVLESHQEFEKQLAKEQNREANVYHGVFATHPDNDKRLREAVAAAEALPHEESMVAIKREAYLDEIQGLPYGSMSKGGVVKNNKFYHEKLGITFTFPKNWLPRNSPAQFVVTNPKNTLAIVLRIEDRNRKQTPEDFLHKRFKNIAGGDSMSLDAEFPGQTAILKGANTPYGNKQARIGVLFFSNKIFKFLAVAKNTDEFAVNDHIFLQTMQSLRSLNQDEYELTKPMVIQLVMAEEDDTFSSLAKDSPLPHHGEEILRLINGSYPEGDLVAGQVIKIVQ